VQSVSSFLLTFPASMPGFHIPLLGGWRSVTKITFGYATSVFIPFRSPAAARSANTMALSRLIRPTGIEVSPFRQAGKHFHFVIAGHYPQNAAGSIENGIGQSHPAPALI